jgi:hypothetical protein
MRAKPFCSKKEQEHCEQADKKVSPWGGIDASKKPFGAKEPKQGEQADEDIAMGRN